MTEDMDETRGSGPHAPWYSPDVCPDATAREYNPRGLASVPLGADAFFKDPDPGGLRSCWTLSRSAPMI